VDQLVPAQSNPEPLSLLLDTSVNHTHITEPKLNAVYDTIPRTGSILKYHVDSYNTHPQSVYVVSSIFSIPPFPVVSASLVKSVSDYSHSISQGRAGSMMLSQGLRLDTKSQTQPVMNFP
jgi:hypothetical protein